MLLRVAVAATSLAPGRRDGTRRKAVMLTRIAMKIVGARLICSVECRHHSRTTE
jgi:hypothetical protein